MGSKNKHKQRSRKTKRQITFKSDDKANHPSYIDDIYCRWRIYAQCFN